MTTILPSAKMVEIKGNNLVVVPHREDEVRVLRNLGFDAPAPMSYYYDWPGLYKPFQHQRITAEFLTLNPRAFCLNGMGCIAGDEKVRVSRKGKSYETDLRTLFAKFTTMPDKGAWKARSLMGDRFGMNKLLDVIYKGDKPTLRITLEDGKTFRCTPDHRIARPDGSWTEAGDLRVGDGLVTNGEVTYTCPECGQPRARATPPRYPEQVCRACKGKAHSAKMTGNSNPAWKGGRWIDPDGYVRTLAHGHHRADHKGYVYEHILVAEAAYGNPITEEYHVHHVNGVKHDNRPENLEVLLASDHHRQHDPRVKLDGSVSAKGGAVVVLPKQARITSIEDGGVVDVYDLCMEAPHHNFVVNGIVVHNSGKTVSVLWAFDYLRKQGRVRKMLIISPLSTLERTWGDEIFRHMVDYQFAVLHGSREKRHKLLDQDFDIYIINHDGIKSKETLDKIMAKRDIDLVVVDEIASFRNSSTERWKYLNRLVNGDAKAGILPMEWVWGLTGTPTPNEPTDAWAQCRLINPSKVPKFFSHFRDSVMQKRTQFKWEARRNAINIVSEAMQPSVRFAREDCIDLPPTTYMTRQVDLTPEQRKAYKEMLNKLTTEVGSGQITAVNEAVKLNKLIQILCGAAYTEDGTVEIPAGPRIELVREVIEQAEAKVIVFVPLTGALNMLANELRKDYTVEVVHGGVSKTERDRIFGDFQKGKDLRVLVANPAAMQHGLTLTAANTIVWFAPTTSNEVWLQANARIVRPGQKLNTLIVQVEASDIERKMYERLQHKDKMQGLLLEMLRHGAD